MNAALHSAVRLAYGGVNGSRNSREEINEEGGGVGGDGWRGRRLGAVAI